MNEFEGFSFSKAQVLRRDSNDKQNELENQNEEKFSPSKRQGSLIKLKRLSPVKSPTKPRQTKGSENIDSDRYNSQQDKENCLSVRVDSERHHTPVLQEAYLASLIAQKRSPQKNSSNNILPESNSITVLENDKSNTSLQRSATRGKILKPTLLASIYDNRENAKPDHRDGLSHVSTLTNIPELNNNFHSPRGNNSHHFDSVNRKIQYSQQLSDNKPLLNSKSPSESGQKRESMELFPKFEVHDLELVNLCNKLPSLNSLSELGSNLPTSLKELVLGQNNDSFNSGKKSSTGRGFKKRKSYASQTKEEQFKPESLSNLEKITLNSGNVSLSVSIDLKDLQSDDQSIHSQYFKQSVSGSKPRIPKPKLNLFESKTSLADPELAKASVATEETNIATLIRLAEVENGEQRSISIQKQFSKPKNLFFANSHPEEEKGGDEQMDSEDRSPSSAL